MKLSDIIERIGQILITHPELLSINDNILKEYGIDFRKCLVGPGIDVLGYFDLKERMNTIIEIGKLEEIQNNKIEALEIIRGSLMKLNFKEVKQNSFIKGNL